MSVIGNAQLVRDGEQERVCRRDRLVVSKLFYQNIRFRRVSTAKDRPCGFVEKPDVATATKYLASGEYFWNAGMFLFRADRFLAELAEFEPAIKSAVEKSVAGATRDLDFIRLEKAAFAEAPAISIDYAVMEKTKHVAVVPVEMGWTDVGSWSALWDVTEKDANGNALIGDVVSVDVKDSYIRG